MRLDQELMKALEEIKQKSLRNLDLTEQELRILLLSALLEEENE